uniref:RZ-type domain-containing protein n=1 Tax=Peronospora matthiolae TaxID=2874970 RepID=A0AAV1UBF8_9STRA
MRNLWMWSLPKRQAALAEWVSAMHGELVEELIEAQEAYQETMNKIETVRDQADIDILTRVQIIGMTTTGVAQNQRKIAAVEPLVVICEEAGEVLEAQLMACLSPACQQLVLIGDHKQLRPHISEYNLSVESDRGKRFALDVSLFERLVSPSSGLPFWMLTEQHRMRPQISQLIRMLFYPKVRDARETLEYPSLRGMNKNVFFVTHDHPEGDTAAAVGTPSRSHSNEYEVAYIIATLIYLLQQGYHTSDIAILTPYVGQLIKLRSALRGKFTLELNELDLDEIHRTSGDEDDDSEDDEMVDTARTNSQASLGAVKKQLSGEIRAATIDNFQGEEATIILASLVRSNTNAQGRGSIGFLKTPNRINVLLSRAKHGLILVGHGDLLRTKSPLWCQVIDHLQKDECYGTGLPLKCQRHSDDLRFATNPGSFAELAPDGGCLRPCGKRLPNRVHDFNLAVNMYALEFVGIPVAGAKTTQSQISQLLLPNTEIVEKSASECCLVVIDAVEFATEHHLVPHVSVFATSSNVNMGLAITPAASLALPARNRAPGAASTMERVICLACPSVCGEDCPTPEFCQVCGDDNIKERVADVIMFRTYGDVDPSEDPVLVLSCCSMVYTMETLDGTLHMGEFYDSHGNPRGALPGNYMSMPQCPNCSKPIRNLRRYGRVTKRAAIDSADKNFISHAQRQLVRLQERTNAAIENGGVTDDRALRHDLRSFGVTVKRPPCQKVYEACVALVTKSRGGQGGGDVYIDSSTLPVPNSSFQYLGCFYLLSAQLSMLGDNVSTRTRAQQYARQAVDLFAEGSFEVQAREARLLLVQILLADAEAKLSKTLENRKEHKERKKAVEKPTAEAYELLKGLRASGASFLSKYGNDVVLLGQRLERIIQRAASATYYQSVSMEEMKLIKMAMQTEFRGSGHWYRCINGHSYSIGECGMAMEETRCPECGAPVGGARHQFVEGTVPDEQMEAIN